MAASSASAPYGRIGYFVLASAFEANPFVVLESLAAGLPVVSTPVGEVPKVVRHGATGYITALRTPEALAAGIGWALAQPRTEISHLCAASMEPFAIENVMAPFYDEHRRAAAARYDAP